MCFIRVAGKPKSQDPSNKAPLAVQELVKAEVYWISLCQQQCFSAELKYLSSNQSLPSNSVLLPLDPFIDSQGVLGVSGRKQESKRAYSMMHPVNLDGKDPLTKLIIPTEHSRLLHAGPTLLMPSLNRWYHIIGGKRIVRSITQAGVICRGKSQKPNPKLMGQLPIEWVTRHSLSKNWCGLSWTRLHQTHSCSQAYARKVLHLCLYHFQWRRYIWNCFPTLPPKHWSLLWGDLLHA